MCVLKVFKFEECQNFEHRAKNNICNCEVCVMLEQSSCKNKMRQENLSISEKTKKIEKPRTSQKRILAPGPYMRKINADESRPREQIENAGVPVEDAKKSRYMLKSLPN